MSQQKVLVPIADGTEELEAITIIDILRRGKLNVTVAGMDELQVKGAHNIGLIADVRFQDCAEKTYDLIALPGGFGGAQRFAQSSSLIDLLHKQREAGRFFAAICASPAVVLATHGLLNGYRATSYPSLISQLIGATAVSEPVVVDRHCITSAGPGTAIPFALKLVELLCGVAESQRVAKEILAS